MSVEFTLKGSALSMSKWNKLFERWVQAKGFESFEEDPSFDDDGGGPAMAYLFGTGCIRGVLFMYTERGVDIRLGAFASRTDWQCAFSLLRAALANGGGELQREDGKVFAAQDLQKASAHTLALRHFESSAAMVSSQFQEQGRDYVACFPTGKIVVPMRAALFMDFRPEHTKRVEKTLIADVQLLASAYRSGTMVMTNGARLGTWALIPTIVAEVDGVKIDYKDSLVPLDVLVKTLGERAFGLGQGLTFLPELDRLKDKAILEALSKESVELDDLARTVDGDGEPEDDGQRQLIAESAKLVVKNALKGNDPAVARRKLVKQGLPEPLAENLVLLVAHMISGILQEERDPAEVTEEIIAGGAPRGIVIPALGGVLGALEEYGRRQSQPKARKSKRSLRSREELKKKAPKRRKRRF